MIFEPFDYGEAWKQQRYDWKRRIGTSQDLSRGAKFLAVQVCDTYANARTACCWPSNATLADLIGVDVRTIQRHLRQLFGHGWIRAVRIKGHRRAFQLVFPAGFERDSRGDIAGHSNVTNPSHERDSRVAPYTEPKRNHRDRQSIDDIQPKISYVLVGVNERENVELWNEWISRNTRYDPTVVFPLIERGNVYLVPSRFPPGSEEDKKRSMAFMEAVFASEGKVLGPVPQPKRR